MTPPDSTPIIPKSVRPKMANKEINDEKGNDY